MTDFYKRLLAHAAWTWNEGKHCRFHRQPRFKDRVSGRNEKRAARQRERRDMDTDR